MTDRSHHARQPSWYQFEPVAQMTEAVLQQVAGLIAAQGWEVRDTRVEVQNDHGKIILPIVFFDDGAEAERIAYIEPGPWDPVAREDVDLWCAVLASSPHASKGVTLWSAREPPPEVLERFRKSGG